MAGSKYTRAEAGEGLLPINDAKAAEEARVAREEVRKARRSSPPMLLALFSSFSSATIETDVVVERQWLAVGTGAKAAAPLFSMGAARNSAVAAMGIRRKFVIVRRRGL